MSKESIDELRNRLLRDPEIQNMIRMRAYEIYQLRGRDPGHQAEDWFRAEMEILQFLIDEESQRAAESSRRETQSAHAASAAANTSIEHPPQPAATIAESAESHSALGVWSATEPHSTTLAPPIGNATEFQIEAPKKTRSRASSKSSSSSKTKGDGSSAKKTARSAASKKATDSPAKPKRTRKKSDESSAENQ